MLTNSAGRDVSSPSITLTRVKLVQVSSSFSKDAVRDKDGDNDKDRGRDKDTDDRDEDDDGIRDGNFRFDREIGTRGGYRLNLDTRGLASGVWQLIFTVTGDSVPHPLPFQIR
jgi:hypothetical protein